MTKSVPFNGALPITERVLKQQSKSLKAILEEVVQNPPSEIKLSFAQESIARLWKHQTFHDALLAVKPEGEASDVPVSLQAPPSLAPALDNRVNESQVRLIEVFRTLAEIDEESVYRIVAEIILKARMMDKPDFDITFEIEQDGMASAKVRYYDDLFGNRPSENLGAYKLHAEPKQLADGELDLYWHHGLHQVAHIRCYYGAEGNWGRAFRISFKTVNPLAGPRPQELRALGYTVDQVERTHHALSGTHGVIMVSSLELTDTEDTVAAIIQHLASAGKKSTFIGPITHIDALSAAIHSSSSPQFIVATVHATASIGIVDRIKPFGQDLPDWAKSSDINVLMIYQEMVPILCQHCKQPVARDSQVASAFASKVSRLRPRKSFLYERKEGGCAHCDNLGNSHAAIVAEVIHINAEKADWFGLNVDALHEYWRFKSNDDISSSDMDGKTATEHMAYLVFNGQVDPSVLPETV